MYRLELRGLAGRCHDGNDESVDVNLVDGLNYQGETFSEYMDDGMKQLVSGGHMIFQVDDDKLYVTVDYDVENKLSDDQLHDLIEYTQGQLSDGIGEGFEQTPCMEFGNGLEVHISPWFYGQVLKAEYYE